MPLPKDKWIYRDEIDLGPEEMRVGVVSDSNVAVDEHPKVYVLYGTTGEYGDKFTWTIGAYTCKDKAVKRMNFLNSVLFKCEVHWDSSNIVYRELIDFDEVIAKMKNLPNGDPNLCIDYTGSKYYIEEIPLLP